MNRLLRAEVRKVLTTKLWWGMLLGAMGLSALGVIAQIATNGVRNNPMPPLSAAVTQRDVISSAAGGDIFALVLGIILVTTEFRHFTSRPTFLIEPRRGRVVGAKLVVSAAIGLVYGALCAIVAVAITAIWLGAKGITIGWSSSGLIGVIVGVLIAVAIYAVVGTGVGVAVRNQVAAVIAALVYVFVVDPLLTVIPYIKDAAPYLPGEAAQALVESSRNAGSLLTQWQGGLVLLGWGLAFAALGWVLIAERDIA